MVIHFIPTSKQNLEYFTKSERLPWCNVFFSRSLDKYKGQMYRLASIMYHVIYTAECELYKGLVL